MIEIMNKWNGHPYLLKPGQSIKMNQSDQNYMVLALFNASETDSAKIAYTSRGSPPKFIMMQPGYKAPRFLIKNWKSNSITLVNMGEKNSADIWAAIYGVGRPYRAAVLPTDGQKQELPAFQACQNYTQSNWMLLQMGSCLEYTVFIVFSVGKPSVFCINAPQAGKVPPGYDDIYEDSVYFLENNWLGNRIYIVNASPLENQSGWITLIDL